MSKVIKTYPIFEGSQVLTSAQLNQMTAYLDQQNRLTRSKLIGIGIVCGLEVSFRSNHIFISKGIGISSEGFLISVGDSRHTHYRPYQLPEGVNYRPFGYPEQDVSLYELLQEIPEDDTGVNPLTPPINFLRDKFVLLFLEIFDQDLKSCLGNSCDDKGKDRIFTIRKLMVSKEDLDIILERSSNVPVAYPTKSNLTKLSIPRVLFDPENAHSNNYRDFSNHYKDRIFPGFFNEVLEALQRSYVELEPLLSIPYNFRNPMASDLITNLRNTWTEYLEEAGDNLDQLKGIQYFYGFLKDLALAYEEFRSNAMEIEGICCADSSLFPKHLMLGKAIPFEATYEEVQDYRHGWVQPPVFNHQKSQIEKVVSLHHRMVMMVEKFDLNQFVNRENTDYPIKIVPSLEKKYSIGKRSIPYYYNIKEESALVLHGHLEKHWDFDFWKNEGKPQALDIPGYNNQAENSNTQRSVLETPLYYDIDSFDFFRIEGHLGKPRNEVLNQLNQLRSRFNLSFQVKTLYLNENHSDPDTILGCGFNDLQEEYRVQRSLILHTIEDLEGIYRFLDEMEVIERDRDGDDEFDLEERLREILEMLIGISESLPECLRDLDFDLFQEAYKKALQAIIDLILIEAGLLDRINVDAESAERELPIINGMLHRLSPILFRFLDLWFFTKILRLHFSYHRRLYYLSRKGLFSSHLRQHPGMEHLAGVPKSGTFLVVYQGSNQQVIADFALPYQCCGDDHCTPSCEEEEDTGYRAAPFARPDYAITLVNTEIEIGIHLNDRGLFNSSWQYQGDEISDEGGEVELIDTGFRYQPPRDFSGIDFFFYTITDRTSGASDQGKVTILVKDPERRGGCYSISILTAWGMEFVNNALENRGVSPDRFNSDTERISHLLSLLIETRGFTEDEIFGSSLEEPRAREALLRAIGLNPSGMDYEQMGNEIIRYQANNCGSQSQPICTVTRVTGQVLDAAGGVLPGVTILVRGTTMGSVSDIDGRFTIDLGSPGQTLVFSFIGFRTQEIDICNQSTLEVMLEAESQPDLRCFTADTLQSWGENNLLSALENTPYRVSPENIRREGFYEALAESLSGTGGFPRTVLQIGINTNPEPWMALLEIVGVSIDTSDPGAVLEAFLGYQNQNCGPASDPFVSNCYPPEILQCWGLKNIQAAIPGLRFLNDDPEDFNNYLLLTATFSRLGGIPAAILETITENTRSLWIELTNCIGVRLNPNANPQAIRQAILVYQAENCSENARIGNLVLVPGSRITESERSRIEEDRISRGDVTLDLGDFTLENPLAGRVTLTTNELGMLTNNTLREISTDLNLSFRTSDNKDTLVNNILNRR